MSTSRFYLVILNQDCPCAIKIALSSFITLRYPLFEKDD